MWLFCLWCLDVLLDNWDLLPCKCCVQITSVGEIILWEFLRKSFSVHSTAVLCAASYLAWAPLPPLPCDALTLLSHCDLGGHDVRHYLRWWQGQVWPAGDQYWNHSWRGGHPETHQSSGKVKVEYDGVQTVYRQADVSCVINVILIVDSFTCLLCNANVLSGKGTCSIYFKAMRQTVVTKPEFECQRWGKWYTDWTCDVTMICVEMLDIDFRTFQGDGDELNRSSYHGPGGLKLWSGVEGLPCRVSGGGGCQDCRQNCFALQNNCTNLQGINQRCLWTESEGGDEVREENVPVNLRHQGPSRGDDSFCWEEKTRLDGQLKRHGGRDSLVQTWGQTGFSRGFIYFW